VGLVKVGFFWKPGSLCKMTGWSSKVKWKQDRGGDWRQAGGVDVEDVVFGAGVGGEIAAFVTEGRPSLGWIWRKVRGRR